jgi:uncharacterized protein with NAD-binding domain and iron-sulfur cluster
VEQVEQNNDRDWDPDQPKKDTAHLFPLPGCQAILKQFLRALGSCTGYEFSNERVFGTTRRASLTKRSVGEGAKGGRIMAQRKPSKARPSRTVPRPEAPERAHQRKLIAFEPEVMEALTVLARDRMQTFQELADEAFADLLKKHGRPTSLKEALRASAKKRE